MIKVMPVQATDGAHVDFDKDIAFVRTVHPHANILKFGISIFVVSNISIYFVRFIGQCTLSYPKMLLFEYCSRGNLRDHLRKVCLFPCVKNSIMLKRVS